MLGMNPFVMEELARQYHEEYRRRAARPMYISTEDRRALLASTRGSLRKRIGLGMISLGAQLANVRVVKQAL
ncbi:MAG: hypothetical protein JXA25_04990 [Anaerolineales bacterium]|nr:hypothetical protein [Anaerolineales bacterium]